MRPAFRIVIDGRQDVTDRFRDRLLSLRVTDEAGVRSDAVEVRLDDRDSAIELPPTGRGMEVSLGWEDRRETVDGTYVVDEVELSGPPQTLAVRAKAADTHSSLKAQKTRSWDDVSLGDLVASIATDHGLKPRVGGALRAVRIPHLDQTEESDLHLLTRLARDHDAVAKPAGGFLLFVPRGDAASATGQPMPVVDVRPEDCRRWSVTIADREAYRSVRAHWHEPESGERRTETAGDGEPAWTLRRTWASASEAREAARAKLSALERGTVRLSLELSPGNPVAAAEAELRLSGFRDGANGSWTCSRAVHRLDRSGYSTTVEAELKGG
ncbi:MAG: contractile injection system protein, VgrG/Pvc8 family [Bryobacterales bacterium]|nr:contractile injection system protein, VgrG/Pvc8 family [Bryobacterales bacterium]